MIHGYDKIYLDQARVSLGRMFDFAVYDLKQDLTSFVDMFITSGVAELFEIGDIKTVAGSSGVELAYEILERTFGNFEHIEPRFTIERSREYWAGWSLAYYQWYSKLSFKEVIREIPICEIVDLYSPYHEMDIMQFVDIMNETFRLRHRNTNLKYFRLKTGLTQKELSEQSEIPLRTIQQYEQKQKNINRAQAEYLVNLAEVLHCKPRELLEKI